MRSTSPVCVTGAGRGAGVRLINAAIATLRESMNIRHQPNFSMLVESTVEKIRDELGEAALQTAFDAGRAMSLEEAVTFALDELKR